MEGDLHVEVADAADGGQDAREAAAPFGPCQRLVVARDDGGDGLLAGADGLLERGPAVGVLERPVSARGHEDVCGDGVAEAHGEVERGLPPWHVAAVDDGGDGVGDGLPRDGLLLGGDLAGARQAREPRDEPPERGVVAARDGEVRRAVRVPGHVVHGGAGRDGRGRLPRPRPQRAPG